MPESKPKKKVDTQSQRSWLKYAGMTTQLAVSIGVCAAIGIYLDGYFNTKPILTVVLALFGVFGGLYIALKDLL